MIFIRKQPMPRKTSETPRTRKIESSISETPKELKPSKNPIDILSQIRIEIKHKNETQKKLTNSIKINDVTICTGPAGTGKSFVAISTALKLLKDHPDVYNNIILLKSITQLKDEMLPSLPGDAMEKMYFQNMSFFDSLIKLVGKKYTEELISNDKIKFDVIGSFRGRNLSNCLIVLDETQNISHDNLKTILTRISENTKIILLGDPEQIDISNKKESSLGRIVNKIKNNPIEGVEIIEFTEEDIVRHRLTSYFIGLFKKDIIVNPLPLKPQPLPSKKTSWLNKLFKKFTKFFN